TSYVIWVNATDPMGSQIFVDAWYAFTTRAPSVPPIFGTPSPENGSLNTPNSFSWGIPISDPDGDPFTWTIQCSNGQGNSATGAANGTKSLSLSDLASSTTYTVWVNATDPTGSNLYTRAWYTFTTQQNLPPGQPNKPSGNASGKIKTLYTYTTSTTDPNGDQVYYNWSWGDGNYSGWLGPFNSGASTSTSHQWTAKGSYSIKVKAKDVFGAESNWSDPLPVTMPQNNVFTPPMPLVHFFEWLCARFPHAFTILRHLLGC
ncbi:MAG TPA: PKD domain-containing protein, partial [Candidatus Thermoplasmatota archaeon]|nr:PKD domain-containing protein [Candidatus Thermoplasmatota archaeon]